MESQMGMVQEAKVVVGLDFGTTFSGFAYALRTAPEMIYTFYDWPKHAESGGVPYCKTQTSLLYAAASDDSDEPLKLRSWGWPAYVEYMAMNSSPPETDHATPDFDYEVVHDFNEHPGVGKKFPPALSPTVNSGSGHFVTLFKLHLAATTDDTTTAPPLPPGMTLRRAITDYLFEISKLILQEVKNKFGPHITLEDLQWCLTVPAIWDEHAKREMREFAEIAGLVLGPKSKDTGSPHPLNLFIEPEAASVYCQQNLERHEWRKGDKFLVVDCGGGTVDLVLQEKLGSAPTLSVREVEESSGGLCGGSKVDDEFFRFMRRRISCFSRFEKEYPATALAFLQTWENLKYEFDGEKKKCHVELPPTLATMWEKQQAASVTRRSSSASGNFDELVLSSEDMRSIFNPVVDRILQLIEERMTSTLQAIMVVGGFSASPYLMSRIRSTFEGRVPAIVSPPLPGSAVCCGAVTMGIQSGIIVSRISKKTYGVRQAKPFIACLHSELFKVEGAPGKFYCNNVFGKFVKGDEVRFDDCVQNTYFPVSETQSKLKVDLYSSDSENVKFVTDVGSEREGTFTIAIPTHEELGFMPKVEVSKFFGRTEVQVTAVGKNFSCERQEMLPIKFERNGIY